MMFEEKLKNSCCLGINKTAGINEKTKTAVIMGDQNRKNS